tara:strand:- start:429 stop:608 length:180 start_codon:yes stop_codon:yes gene_type:complete
MTIERDKLLDNKLIRAEDSPLLREAHQVAVQKQLAKSELLKKRIASNPVKFIRNTTGKE